MTGPYFHDGSVDSLPDAVRAIARLQLGVTAGDKDVGNIVAFLGSLTGTLPNNFATAASATGRALIPPAGKPSVDALCIHPHLRVSPLRGRRPVKLRWIDSDCRICR
jgi:hypothetical protein